MVLSLTIIHANENANHLPTFALEASGKSPGNAPIASFLVPAQKAKRNHPGNEGFRILLPKNRDTSLPAMLLETTSLRDEA